jgi:hypothetical protein
VGVGFERHTFDTVVLSEVVVFATSSMAFTIAAPSAMAVVTNKKKGKIL